MHEPPTSTKTSAMAQTDGRLAELEVAGANLAASLDTLEHCLAELEADLSNLSESLDRLERLVLDQRPASVSEELNDRWDDIAQEVEAELFAYDLKHREEEED